MATTTTPLWIASQTAEGADDLGAQVGGKAASLLRLQRCGLPVPAWFCLTTAAFDRACAPFRDQVLQLLARVSAANPASIEKAAAEIAQRFADTPLPDEVLEAIRAGWRASLGQAERVAVRSSALGEDSASDSFAGQLDSFLNVSLALVPARVSECMASAWSARAIAYRLARGRSNNEVRAAVVVQQMIAAEGAGVLFTSDPTGDVRQMVISAGLGLGEGVVSDRVETDTYRVDRETRLLCERQTGSKRRRVIAGAEGTVTADVPAERAAAQVLSDAEIAELAELGRRVEALAGSPQDIEWAIGPGRRLWLLQARPITAGTAGRESVFDNSNLVESYPGLSTPLTFSFVRDNYCGSFAAAATYFGMSRQAIAELEVVLANLVALVDGRIYYNILNWYALYLQLPGMDRALPAFEKGLGIEPRQVRSRASGGPVARAASQTILAARLARHFVRLDGEVEAFLSGFRAVQEDFYRRPLDTLDAHELCERIEWLCRRVRGPYGVAVLNDFYAMQLHEALGRLLERFGFTDPSGLRNRLLAGARDMQSLEPARSLLALVASVRASASLRALFDSDATDEQVSARLRVEPPLAAFRAELDEHVRRFGDRVLHELKLETPTLTENPGFAIRMIRNCLAQPAPPHGLGEQEQSRRISAEAEVAGRLRLRPGRRALLDFVLKATRRSIVHRENLRLARSRAYGLCKRAYRVLARRFVEAGLLDDPGDLLYLTTEEVAGAVRGHGATCDLRALVRLRRQEYALHATRTLPGRVVAHGMVVRSTGTFAAAPGAGDPSSSGTELRGIGCGPGRASGTAKVVLDPTRDLIVRGEILVAPMTDPGWVFLMLSAGGLIVERGSLLSHTAIIGRELGLPTVVAVAGATRRIRDGQRVTLDGATGLVMLHEPDEPTEPTDPLAGRSRPLVIP
jgi:pyruvate,water dikinase